ncbi:hypothetical protein [Pseudoxanthomonas putridarboris]|uniref:J domain-containing protein n=1 Tax=Pseudoxanthomonas putridarboris TaxID=752605 RepID=A0ABU9J2U2_9GAMM
MQHAFRLLGIGADADEREIKRAYAKKLKQTRPDDDPAGFQRLNEAYQSALAHCRHRASAPADGDDERIDDGAGDSHLTMRLTLEELMQKVAQSEAEPPGVPPTAVAEPIAPPPMETPPMAHGPVRIDVAAIARQVLASAGSETPARLREWLARHDDLYLLVVKQRVGQSVFEQIAYDEVPVRPANLQVLGEFFDIAPPAWVEQRMRVRRAVESNDTATFDEERPVAIRQLKRRFWWPQALLMACFPGLAQRIARLARRLESDYGGDVPGIDPAQRRFFGLIAHPYYFGAWRWASVAATAAFATALVGAIGLLGGAATDRVMQVAAYTFSASAVLLFLWHLMRLMWALRGTPYGQRPLALALLPAWLALAGLLAGAFLPTLPGLAYALVAPAALLYFQRFFDGLRFALGLAWLASFLPDRIPAPSSWVIGLAGAAIGMTVMDVLYARRHRLPVSAAVGNRWTMIASYVFFGVSLVLVLGAPLLPLWTADA